VGDGSGEEGNICFPVKDFLLSESRATVLVVDTLFLVVHTFSGRADEIMKSLF